MSRLAGNQVLFTSFTQIWNKFYDDSKKKKEKEKETHTILDSSKEVYFIFLEVKKIIKKVKTLN